MPAVPAMPTAENSSAGKTFSMSRWAMMLPIVARRSPAITTPLGNVAATIVVPCGASVVTALGRCSRRPGSNSGDAIAKKSANDEMPGVRNAAGSRPAPFVKSANTPPSEASCCQVFSGTYGSGLLAALLDVPSHELFGVLFEHVVDVVEQGVDVVRELFVALLEVG